MATIDPSISSTVRESEIRQSLAEASEVIRRAADAVNVPGLAITLKADADRYLAEARS